MINLSKFLPFFIPNVYRACSFFTNLDLFCIDNARVIYRKIRYYAHAWILSYFQHSAHSGISASSAPTIFNSASFQTHAQFCHNTASHFLLTLSEAVFILMSSKMIPSHPVIFHILLVSWWLLSKNVTYDLTYAESRYIKIHPSCPHQSYARFIIGYH